MKYAHLLPAGSPFVLIYFFHLQEEGLQVTGNRYFLQLKFRLSNMKKCFVLMGRDCER